jgi:demethylmenaquinone methyltransferase/2-methoxy-6-polyprenyl-1,4-benzoquinol methylase
MSRIDEIKNYYASVAPVYNEIAGYKEAESEKLRDPAKARYYKLFKERRVLEIACGSGYWTEVIGQVAKSVLATDFNHAMLALAANRCCRLPNVKFLKADAYSLDGVPGDFDATFANCWWSHIPRKMIPVFLATLHNKLKPGSLVLFVDQLPDTSGFCATNTKSVKITDEDRLELRSAPDGKTYEIVKNLPTHQEIREHLAGRAQDISYLEEQGVWSVMYTTLSR